MSTRFSNLTIARNPKLAFIALREEALYLYGHGRKTNTIGDKTFYVMAGTLGSSYLDNLDTYWHRTEAWHIAVRKNKRKYPQGVPESVAPMFVAAIARYVDPDGPAICFQITGTRVSGIKSAMGLKRRWGNAYWFGGYV